jgi:hypothetical protein
VRSLATAWGLKGLFRQTSTATLNSSETPFAISSSISWIDSAS